MKKIIGFLAVMLFSTVAAASVAIHDNAGAIPSDQRASLISEGTRWPFDLHVFTGVFATKAALEQSTHQCVTSPNVVCIGLDPTHHGVRVNFGTATGVRTSDFNLIAASGNSYFKSGDWKGGIESIADRALESSRSSVSAPVSQVPVQVHVDMPKVVNTTTGMSTGWWLFAIFISVLVGVGIWIVTKARKTVSKINDDMNDFRDEAFEMSSRNMEERDWHEKMKSKQAPTTHPMTPVAKSNVPAPTPTPVSANRGANVTVTPGTGGVAPSTTVVNNVSGGNNGASTTDMLLAYELGRLTTPQVVPTPVVTREVVREVVREPEPSSGSSSSWSSSSRDDDNDKGGSSSDWGSSSSDSSSSWDSGGGSDSGGGGGSDW